MVVYEGIGNVFNHEAEAFVIPVNTVGVMGAGLALSARNRILGINDFYKKNCKEGVLRIGHNCLYSIPESDKKVLLFATKEHFKDPSKVEYIEKGLLHLVATYKEWGIESLAVPGLGCGLGQLNYQKEVKPLLYQYLDPIELNCHILIR